MSRARIAAAPGRAAGAQHAKAMLLALQARDIAVAEVTERATPPDSLAPVIETHVATEMAAAAPFRAAFFGALAEWLARQRCQVESSASAVPKREKRSSVAW